MARQNKKNSSSKRSSHWISRIISIIVAIVLLVFGKVGIYDKLNDQYSLMFKNAVNKVISQVTGHSETAVLPYANVKQMSVPQSNGTSLLDGTVQIAGDGKSDFSSADINTANTKKDGYVGYSQLDEKGRTRQVTAVINYNMVHANSSSVKKRPDFPETTQPSGWKLNSSFNGTSWNGGTSNNRIVHANGLNGYFYNKSHLVAYSLGGDMNTHNVITGTRQQNVGFNNQGGMAYLETKVRNLINGNHSDRVFYRATPVYNADELVPRSVVVQAYSLNDQGSSIDESVAIPNVQRGFTINYGTGAFTQ